MDKIASWKCGIIILADLIGTRQPYLEEVQNASQTKQTGHKSIVVDQSSKLGL